MEKDNLTRVDWLKTISNLISREISRRRLSGSANWVLIALAVYFFYKGISEWIPSFYVVKNLFPFLLFSSVFLNLGTVVFCCYVMFFKFSKVEDTRCLPRLRDMSKGGIFASMSLFSFSVLIINALSTYFLFLENGPFFAGALLTLIWLITFLIFAINGIRLYRQSSSIETVEVNAPEPETATKDSNKESSNESASPLPESKKSQAFRIVFYVFSGATLFVLLSKFPPVMNENIVNMISYALQFSVFHFVLLFSILRFWVINKEALLEELERKILVDQIDLQQIKKEYESLIEGKNL
ncbi:MAG: hypothetical protein ACQETH_10165 [Candidatus Rifleibacteriota bacterium]